MADVAALNLAVNSDPVEQANVRLREMPKAANAAERAAQKYSATTMNAANSNEQFSKRTQAAVKSLEFERQQLLRSSAEREKYAALRRAGVSAMSAEGQAISASVAALQAQRVATKASADSARAAGSGFSALAGFIGPAVLAYIAIAKAQEMWTRALKAADLGEQAEQIGVNTDQLQAYRFAGAQAGIEAAQMDVALTKLAKTMGAAADGGKEQIELFEKLGVKLLDAQGELRPTADVLPEVAKGILGIGSSSQRTATLMEIFGKSGAKMATVLEEIAKGNDSVVISAKAAGAVASPEIIKAWDDYADSLKRAELQADVTYAKLGAPIATAGLEGVAAVLKRINETMDQINSKEGFWQSILNESRAKGSMGGLKLATPEELEALKRESLARELKNPNNAGREGMIQADIDRLNRGAAQENFSRLGGLQSAGAPSGRFLPAGGATKGTGNPTPKGSGDAAAKAWQSMIDGAKEYIATQAAAQAAIGLSAEAAARLKHETELLNKVQGDGRVATDAQKVAIADLATKMAAADATLATAKFMDDANKTAEQFIATQQIERDTLFMSTEAAMAYRLEQEALNKAKADGIVLTDAEKQKLGELAGAQAAVAEKTRRTKEIFDFGRESFQGFFADMNQGLRDGKTVVESFGDAFMNVLNKVSDKLMQMAIDDLFSAAFGGAKGAGAGGLGGLLGGIFGGGASGTASGALDGVFTSTMGSPFMFAKGGAFDRGNVIPFATGGVVSRPTVFPMARGMGLMGEAGPEGVLPLRRGRGGRLGVEANGGGGGRIDIYVHDNTEMLEVTIDNRSNANIVRATPAIVDKAVSKSTQIAPRAVEVDKQMRSPDWRLGSV